MNNLLDIESPSSPDDVWTMIELRWRDEPKSDTGKVVGSYIWSQQLPGRFLTVASWVAAQ